MWDSTDYQLDWPRELLAGELVALRDHPYRGYAPTEIEPLLIEAFHTGIPAAEFNHVVSIDIWQDASYPGSHWLDDLLAHLDEIREYSPPRPCWATRHAAPAKQSAHALATAPQCFAELVGSLKACGYLDRDFSEGCAYGDPDYYSAGGQLAPALEQRLDLPDLWPLRPDGWDEDTFYGLIEVFHDLVARPRSYFEHQDCGSRHFAEFDTDAGRRVYRALVNRLLAENAVQLRLAESGEDAGRLVHLADEGRTELVQRSLASPEPDAVTRIAHAIALFRGRGATEHDKRSAVVALALVLEERRQFLKTALFRDDECTLFHIANKFAIRHQDTKQHTDYDPMFLDWIFWCYLSTIELSDRLLARQSAQTSMALR